MSQSEIANSFIYNSAEPRAPGKSQKALLSIVYKNIIWYFEPSSQQTSPFLKYSFSGLTNPPLLPRRLIRLLEVHLICPSSHLPGEELLSTATSGKGGKTTPLIFPNPNCSETFLPSSQSHSTSSHAKYLSLKAPTSNMVEAGVPGGLALSQPSDEGGQRRLRKGGQGFKQHVWHGKTQGL